MAAWTVTHTWRGAQDHQDVSPHTTDSTPPLEEFPNPGRPQGRTGNGWGWMIKAWEWLGLDKVSAEQDQALSPQKTQQCHQGTSDTQHWDPAVLGRWQGCS